MSSNPLPETKRTPWELWHRKSEVRCRLPFRPVTYTMTRSCYVFLFFTLLFCAIYRLSQDPQSTSRRLLLTATPRKERFRKLSWVLQTFYDLTETGYMVEGLTVIMAKIKLNISSLYVGYFIENTRVTRDRPASMIFDLGFFQLFLLCHISKIYFPVKYK